MTLDPAGRPFVVAATVLALALAVWTPWLGVAGAALVLFMLNFFRDPERRSPDDPDALLSPADGKIIRADASRVSIFMNVFDVHVCRSPVGGRVTAVTSEPGRFVAAMKDAASERNERTALVVSVPERESVRFVLVAGLIARRIVCRAGVGQNVRAGERVGMIRFGSRVDVDLPTGASPAVRVGQRVIGGETVVARWGA
ncbi:MAG TPA: phosphatidylserine decarboxylase [Candidatus Polarisedimenticolaceae bacterium]|nr:phosphatidylserine decarboxylase [Candidatus Polarisedimenticolaceae bacterium]